jgi:hypothetical protein
LSNHNVINLRRIVHFDVEMDYSSFLPFGVVRCIEHYLLRLIQL